MNTLQDFAKHLGLHKKYNVDPDIAIFGKALGNGYAIIVIGRKDIMSADKHSSAAHSGLRE